MWPVLVSPVISPLSQVDGLAKMLSTEEDLQVEAGGRAAIDVVLTLGRPCGSTLMKILCLRGCVGRRSW